MGELPEMTHFSERAPAARLDDDPERSKAAPDAGPRRVLVVEDDRDSAEGIAALLRLRGHSVEVALDGPSALAKARDFRPDVVLCDIGLPGELDGYEVARALRSDPALKSARLIALTGYGQRDDQRRANEAGFDAHLTKPADLTQLEALLQAPPPRPVP
jgi:two-component system CheB/CheR fusion protein